MLTTNTNNLTVMTPSGLAVELTITEVYGNAQITHAAIPARGLSGGGSIFCPAAKGAPSGVTHCFRLDKVMIGFGADQAALILDALASKQADIDATPERQAQRLRDTRAGLVSDLNAALDEAMATRDRAWERGDERGGVTANRHDAAAEIHRTNLALFDAERPEVLAEIKTAKTMTADQILGL